ncbi:MAG: hypothetical protein A3I61_16105 [Acidobacteria bacterium RIFCSPLOWO2_02_FULL_68_18]|nr:MAG: hypothetical protein A3I61_16105 [Acidobacteria bacterium RIFCSPLOWO2_02_FULL_68_18]OFW48957.1 MAG: hypothetical protein A3G77_05185 [Acidobacteria bacterium RIFCSPLOWO2_12_FULL_68_19]
MRAALAVTILCLGLTLSATPTMAHHSFAAEFDAGQPITLTGTLTRMEWVNPHGWIYVEVKDPSGKVINWAIEAGAPNALLRRGLRKTDFPVGVEVVVKGYRAKNGTPTANGQTVTFKDGRNFFLGASDSPSPTAEAR